VFVLFARVRLAAVAAGGLLGGLAAGRVTSAVGPGTALRVELAVEALTYLGLLLTRDPAAAAVLLAFLAANLAVFSSVGAALRQSLAPPGMLGRVQGGYRAVSNSGLLAGAALGGLLTAAAGLTAPSGSAWPP
jgi:predicted MFS family arabinose efflux permease